MTVTASHTIPSALRVALGAGLSVWPIGYALWSYGLLLPILLAVSFAMFITALVALERAVTDDRSDDMRFWAWTSLPFGALTVGCWLAVS